MKKLLIICVSVFVVLISVYVILTASGSYFPPYTVSAVCNFSLEKDTEYIEKLSNGNSGTSNEQDYLNNKYIPHKISLNIKNRTMKNFFASKIPIIETEEYIIEIHQFDTPFHNGVSAFNNTTIDAVIWLKEDLTEDEIKDIVNSMDLKIELLYYFPPFSGSDKSIEINCDCNLIK